MHAQHVSCNANPVRLISETYYDFTGSASSAYGANQRDMEDGFFAFFSGDVTIPTPDGFIGSDDETLVDNDNESGVSGGYLATDISGDGYVGTDDETITDNNNITGITSQHP